MNNDFKKTALNLADQAGKIIRANFKLSMKKSWKSDNTPLTLADNKINDLVIETINSKHPKHQILAEEGDDMGGDSKYVWVCDPIDGTIPFSHGIPTSVFSLALTDNGKPILGVVYDPYMERLFFAKKGMGATLNNKKISVSKNDDFFGSLVGFSGIENTDYNYPDIVKELNNQNALTMNNLSATYMGALVSNGEFAGNIFFANKPHDSAALKIIIEEAGGTMTNLFGNEQRYDKEINGHIAANPKMHKKILSLIQPLL